MIEPMMIVEPFQHLTTNRSEYKYGTYRGRSGVRFDLLGFLDMLSITQVRILENK